MLIKEDKLISWVIKLYRHVRTCDGEYTLLSNPQIKIVENNDVAQSSRKYHRTSSMKVPRGSFARDVL